ncbi:MAG: gliding motility-associated C-terminal domain-containing protein [Elusimicrobia bacterium]|nr:gliding motility-associated C-terminal domain-containing protein [Elusimicrobiota bacterium]
MFRAFLLIILAAAPAAAMPSSSARFRNDRSGMAGGGLLSGSTSFSNVDTIADLGGPARSAPSFASRAGLIGIYLYPGRVGSLRATGCQASGVVLTWTAPGNDGHRPGTRAAAYRIRYSTDAALSPASSDVRFVQGSEVAAPAPSPQGSPTIMTVGGLTDGLTYYFAIEALEADLTAGPLSPGATAPAGSGSLLPPEPFVVLPEFRRARLSWGVAPGLSGTCVPASYRVYHTTAPAQGYALAGETTGQTLVDPGLTTGTTYYYRVIGLDPGAIEVTPPASASLVARSAAPTPPLRVGLAIEGSSATITWTAPSSFDIGEPFADPAGAQPDELSAFVVSRSDRLLDGTWVDLAVLSSATASYLDPAPGPSAYYRVFAKNISDGSAPSLTLEAATEGASVVAPDGRSHLFLPKRAVARLQAAAGGYWVRSATEPVTPGVYNSARWDLLDAAGAPDPLLRLGEMEVRLGYETDPSGRLSPVGALAASPAEAGATAQDATLYWNNGVEWVKVYGRVEPGARWVSASTELGGAYQVRAISRRSTVDFDVSNVSNRFLTPNGDGKNDNVVFRFDNPRDSRVTGRIFDVKGRVVTTLSRKTQFTMEWDGRSDGRPVPSGVYLYQLEGDGKRFNGTLVVVK